MKSSRRDLKHDELNGTMDMLNSSHRALNPKSKKKRRGS
jgi:hypothetical protein